MTHWKQLTNPDYLGAYSLDEGQELIVTIQSVRNEMVTGPDGKKEECVVAHFAERNVKPMILNVTNMKMITKLSGTPYIEKWAGLKIKLHSEKVKAFGEVVDALRVCSELPTEEKFYCADCKKEIQGFGNKSAQWVASHTYKNYGVSLCSECASVRKAQAEENETDG